MSNAINPIPRLPPLDLTNKAQPNKNAASPMANLVTQALDNLSQQQNNSDALLQKLAAGENVDLHQVMIAAEQTDIGFKVTMAMRDKLVDAYHEVMRMSV